MKDTNRGVRVLKPNTKWLATICLLLSSQIARAQVKTGTILYVNFTPSDLTVAADSRMTIAETGEHDDAECKISAFGNKFVFAMAGVVFPNDDIRNPHFVARQIWDTESLTEDNEIKLVSAVAKEWAARMEQIYAQSGKIDLIRKHTGGEALANAMFAATDSRGQMAVVLVAIDFDGKLFDTSGYIRITHNLQDLPAGTQVSAGFDEIANEYGLETSDRAKEYMTRFKTQISNLPPMEQRARIASKLVELSVLFDPHKDELGFPIDVLQLRPTEGINWVSIKANCPQN
jgi:hypothetical protein